jgi:hypothetical protein
VRLYWIDPADCGEDSPEDVRQFRARVQMALPDGWTAEIVGESDHEHVSDPAPPEIERVVELCWQDHCRDDGEVRP